MPHNLHALKEHLESKFEVKFEFIWGLADVLGFVFYFGEKDARDKYEQLMIYEEFVVVVTSSLYGYPVAHMKPTIRGIVSEIVNESRTNVPVFCIGQKPNDYDFTGQSYRAICEQEETAFALRNTDGKLYDKILSFRTLIFFSNCGCTALGECEKWKKPSQVEESNRYIKNFDGSVAYDWKTGKFGFEFEATGVWEKFPDGDYWLIRCRDRSS